MMMDEILSSCPSPAEIASIQRDFVFKFDGEPGPAECIHQQPKDGDDFQYNPLFSLIQAFRCMKALTFDSAIPLIGSNNLYSWLRDHRIEINVFSAAGYSSAYPNEPIHIQGGVFGWWLESWTNENGLGMNSLIGLLVHETCHSIGFPGHNVSSNGHRWIVANEELWRKGRGIDENGEWTAYILTPDGRKISPFDFNIPPWSDLIWAWDSSPEYGGPWAAQYWYQMWLAQHSNGRLTDVQRTRARLTADELYPQLHGGKDRAGSLARIEATEAMLAPPFFSVATFLRR